MEFLRPNISERIENAKKRAQELEPWPGYYVIRGREMRNLFAFLKLNSLGRVLDIGCGNAFMSYLLSSVSSKVIATDLYVEDSLTHSIGIKNAGDFLSKVNIKNIPILASSIENLPFKFGSFDTVFSSYTIHYLKDRAQGLKEIKRVVKDTGIVILILPNFTERFFAFIQFYLYFFRKLLTLVKQKLFTRTASSVEENYSNTDLFSFRQNYKHFPFPGPHGAYKNSAVEMIRHMPFNWNKEFRDAGFKLSCCFTTVFAPYPLLLTLSVKAGLFICAIYDHVFKIFADKRPIKYFGFNYCVIIKK